MIADITSITLEKIKIWANTVIWSKQLLLKGLIFYVTEDAVFTLVCTGKSRSPWLIERTGFFSWI